MFLPFSLLGFGVLAMEEKSLQFMAKLKPRERERERESGVLYNHHHRLVHF